LIFSLILVVFIYYSSCHEAVSRKGDGPPRQMTEGAHITLVIEISW